MALVNQMASVRLERGEQVFTESEPGDRLYVVREGKVKLVRRSSDGRENLLTVVGPGEMLGELSLFDPGPRTSSAVAITEAVVLELDHDQLTTWLNQHPSVALHLLQALAKRLRRTTEAHADLVFSDVPGRVARALLELSGRFGEPMDGGVHVPHDLTQVELAQLVGASRETVNKSLGEFAQRGWLVREPRGVLLLDVERLEHRALR
ncbi:MAG: Crp/Fnr family transcriptional regulator [Micrococcales bacterium]|nr:Crp/Fnr family transcriptional regulator [Micrococcales bacterium]MCL2666363.1 Crp/Fnr family transcriptional regulator [Micrococcales bacterium]